MPEPEPLHSKPACALPWAGLTGVVVRHPQLQAPNNDAFAAITPILNDLNATEVDQILA